MAKYNLTQKQKELLRTLVGELLAGTAREPFTPIIYGTGSSLMGVAGNFDKNLVGDLDILVEQDLLGVRFTSKGSKTYTAKQSAYDAVENNFEIPEDPTHTQYIGAFINTMSGGNLQAIGLSNQSEINQIVNDPKLLEKQVNELINQLLEVIKTELSADKLISYVKTMDSVKQEINSEKPSSGKLNSLFTSLAFMGDIEGTISLAARVWPYIYPLLVIAAERITNTG